MQAAQQLVELREAGGDAGELARPAVGCLGRHHGLGKGGPERLKSALGLPDTGQVVELLFGDFYLFQGRFIERRLEGAVHDILAESDELPQQIEVVNEATEIAGIDDVHGRRGEGGNVRGAAGFLHRLVILDVRLERYRAHDLPALDDARQGIEDLAVQRIGEVLAFQELRDPMIGRIVHEDRAQQSLFRLEIVRRLADDCGELNDVGGIRGGVFFGLHARAFAIGGVGRPASYWAAGGQQSANTHKFFCSHFVKYRGTGDNCHAGALAQGLCMSIADAKNSHPYDGTHSERGPPGPLQTHAS